MAEIISTNKRTCICDRCRNTITYNLSEIVYYDSKFSILGTVTALLECPSCRYMINLDKQERKKRGL